MNHKWNRIILSVAFLIILLFSTGSAVADSTTDPQADWLFADTQETAALDFVNDPTIARSRLVTVKLGLLDGAEVGGQLVLNFFEDASFTAILDRKQAGASGGYTWTGHLEGIPLGNFALAIGGGQMAGNVSTPEGAYAIRYAGNGVHALQQIDQTKLPAEAEPIPVDLPEEAIAAAADQPMPDDGSVIEVMVVWTPAARSAAGGTTAMENLVNLAVAEANQSYLNSGINPQLNLVHMQEVTYTESGSMATDLTRLQNPADGNIDLIHGLRDTYYADQVAMIVESTEACGIGYLMSTVSTAFETNAFTVVARNCATGYYSYAHELGHNQGARHDWYVDDTTNSPYSYNKGKVYVPGPWRTIMAYNTECADALTYCTRLPYWSNPDVLYGGIPMGVPIGTNTSCIAGVPSPNCDADNRTTLNNTAWTVANFRDHGASAIGPMVYDGHTVDDDNLGNSSGNENGIVDCGETIELYTTLWNQGADTATSVLATISTSDPYVTWLYNTTSSYPDIPGGSTGDNYDDYDFYIDPGTPHGHIINFNLDISAASGGPWSDSFEVPVSCVAAFPEIEVTPPSFTVNLNVGQVTTEILTIENLGGAPLEFNIYDVETGTPDPQPVRMLNDGPVPSTDNPEAFSSLKSESQILAGASLGRDLNDVETVTNDPEAFPVVKTESQILASNPVLIIQDYDPWGFTGIQDILTANGIGYDLVNSTAIASIDLSPYTMVVIPSTQGDSFYTTLNTYISKFETYVINGGKLWQSTCNQVGETEPLTPGGVVSSDDAEIYNVLIEPGHPWVAGVPSPFYGSYASHDSFSSLYPGSIVVATTEISGNPTLVDYRYGAGRVLITGQTLEIAWGYSPPWDGAPILENSLLELYYTPLAADVLIIQDNDPWGTTSTQDILNAHGIAFHLADSSMIPTIDLSPYTMVIIPSVQGDSFYTTFNAYLYKFEDYVSNGGKLWQSSCNFMGSIEPLAPGGVVSADDPDEYNVLIEPGHPWVAGVPSPFYGYYASHDSFSSLYPGSLVVATAQTSGNPTLVDYRYGAGRTLITGQPLEFFWAAGWEGAPILENSLLDLYYAPLTADVLIIQDSDPWGSTATKDILNAHGIAFNLADSASIPTINLAPYRMVIIPSVQGDSFYTTFNANIGKFEAYVNAGGRLWQSTCNYSATPTEPLVPGGVVSATDLDTYNLILEPGHPWVTGVPSPFYGSYASHDSFSSLYPGSIVVATAQTSGKPTLVDYRYGAGMMLITGQTLEYAWGALPQWEGAPILEYSLIDLYNRASGPDAPWLSENPVTGTIPAQDSALIDVTFDATGLVPGTYTANIVIANNDPDENPTIVPVTLNVGGCPGGPNLDYFTTQDNEDNALSGYGDCDMDVYLFNDNPLVPIEFNIFIPDPSGVNQLMINAYDVDETGGEVDEIYFNGHFAGTLTGADATWSTTVLPIDPAWVVPGNNLVTIFVDVTNPDPWWAVNVDWGQVNKVVPTAHIRYVDIGTPPYPAGTTMVIEVEVDSDLASQDLRTEVNLRNPGGVILDGQVIYHTVNGANNDAVVANLTIPAGELGPNYDIQVLVFDAVTSRFQDAAIVQFEVSPQSQTQLWVDPVVKDIPFEGTDTVDLIVTDVANLYGISLELAFDPAIVEVVSITPGSCPSPDFIVQNTFDNTLGKIYYDVTALSPSLPCSGNGIIATVEFKGKIIDVSELNFVNWLLTDKNGFAIPVLGVHNGELNVVFIHGFVNGFIQMQGRTDHSGAEVCAWDGPTNVGCATTVADGSYELQLLPGIYDITVEMGRYLDSVYPGVTVTTGSTTTLPTVVLPGGDGNDDDLINILDLSFMAARYLCSIVDPCYDARGDINNDEVINIQDLAITGGNYGKTSPVPWP